MVRRKRKEIDIHPTFGPSNLSAVVVLMNPAEPEQNSH